jgi:hypothetical protein
MKRTLLFSSLLLLACAGAGESQGAAHGHRWTDATLTPSCAPWDGQAVSLLLADSGSAPVEERRPLIAIHVYRSMSEVMPAAISFDSKDSRTGGSEVCPEAGDCRSAQSTEVRFDAPSADGTVSGSYRLDLGEGRLESGAFKARLVGQRNFCG